ncbi:PREDICTED: valine--tRNA ligase, mitochondrial-like isoform X2 [Dinoponera quadriceps]|uniref:valine--tRNA ligase n=1 Tax=Dinoponera quadriceps TaxID=609295 RepID=A0A6P3XVY6_DINQU|nr:PREDICTED: valine--tRNA ligase, mitochondrial-like isoform X2 [Dinoponera quadriceps]XP_014482256.1 PREDICTED: valine--tRNA ligase, mitochondrial-like isoform X2 [Dinoponera quadriceps]XP_014482257.1 PREDICTED: valine--tRNA ligase, mitochondrial-like isoform X2 [Dinoponera quadriceps]
MLLFFRKIEQRSKIDFPATYNIENVEQRYNVWQQNKYFASSRERASDSDRKDSFTMILPPPNITGVLHLGHALTATVQDVLARWYRMRGYSVLWIPGLDHAGIATQVVVEKHLRHTRNLSRLDLTREEFTSLVWRWKADKAGTIRDQLKMLGASLDWDREYFTVDQRHSAAVTEAFVRLHERGLLYRGCDFVNWSPSLRSTVSEIEVVDVAVRGSTKLSVPGYRNKVTFGRMMKLAYPVEDSEEELIVATTRPETIFGDVALAVHPDDERYARYIGRRVTHPVRNVPIPIVADSAVRKDFGTGVLKITPAHDRRDHGIAKKHNLPLIGVINEDGNMTDVCKGFEGLPRFDAREKLMHELFVRGVLRDVNNEHSVMLPRCSRSQDIVEQLLKEQWFVKCDEMAKNAVDALENESLRIVPDVHEQQWRDWLGNIRDWCVSRQLWWGHQIPAYSVVCDGSWIVARSEEEAHSIARRKYGDAVELRRDGDVLDTWFSSAIVPFATLGWPEDTQDMAKYYPLSLMETGHDILMLWVARMVMLGLELTQRLPFKEVLLHGVLCDANGRKMSKSSGNVISPESIINGCSLEELNAQATRSHEAGILSADELRRTLRVNAKSYPEGIIDCGVDALRMALCSRNIKNHNVSFDIADCRTYKNLCNKIWQASKYMLLMVNEDREGNEDTENLSNLDRWILSRLSQTVETVNTAFAERDFYKAAFAIRQFLHYEFCDFYLEGTKFGFRDGDARVASGHSYTLKRCLEVSLRLFAPLVPYLADDLYTRLAKKLPMSFLQVSSLLEAEYPEFEEFEHLRNVSLEEDFQKIIDLIDAIRTCMANVSKKLHPEVNILTGDARDYDLYKDNVNLIKGVSRIWNVPIHLTRDCEMARKDNHDEIRYVHTDDCSLHIAIADASATKQIKRNIERKRDPNTEKPKASPKLKQQEI